MNWITFHLQEIWSLYMLIFNKKFFHVSLGMMPSHLSPLESRFIRVFALFWLISFDKLTEDLFTFLFFKTLFDFLMSLSLSLNHHVIDDFVFDFMISIDNFDLIF